MGIGASAGGLDALIELVSELPAETPIAIVVVQHLDPSHRSALTEMLARATPMPVVEAKDGMRAEPAHVYVIAPNASMTITKGVLQVAPRERSGHMTVDHFFRSLAEDCGNRAIGVVLSGNASDGALGVAAIKASGGITFAQDPETARYSGMPRSAVASGAVDFILPPRQIARELKRLARNPYLRGDSVAAAPTSSDGKRALEGIFRILQREVGVDFTHYRQTTIRRRISRRMLVHQRDTLEAYHEFLVEHPAEVTALYNDLLISVTRFFRDVGPFQRLQQKVFPRIVKRRPDGAPIRVWVPACATGEEAYSIAMLLLETLGDAAGRTPIQIFGTDVSETAIARARAGVYPSNIELDVSRERLRKFFVKGDGQYQVTKSLRDLCVFARHDLARDPPFSNMDLISCRNVLIYLEPSLQKQVMSVLHFALRHEGFLLLGGSETPGPLGEHFSVVDREDNVHVKKAIPTRRPASANGRAMTRGQSRTVRPAGAPRSVAADELPRQIDRLLLMRYAPAGVLVNDAMEILQFRGHTSPFLEPAPGQASFNLLKMAREGLLLPLRELIARVRKLRVSVRREGVRMRQGGTFAQVAIEVLPVTGPYGERHYFVLFEDVVAAPALRTSRNAAREAPKAATGVKARGQVDALRQELVATKEFLQSLVAERDTANEDLRAANEEVLSGNEELQSTNEELQSTNEELETAKEELQSSNEELTTLNDELRHRNAELSLLNDDLNNLFASTNLPMLMLDAERRLRRFTAMAAQLFDLVPGDVGRPLRDVRPNLECPALEALCEKVMAEAMSSEHEVSDREGRWYSLRVRPYRAADNRVEGCVIVLSDITALKSSAQKAEAASRFARGIVDTVREPLLVLDGGQRVVAASRSFYETFRTTPAEAEGRSLHELGAGQWVIPPLRAALQDVIDGDTPLEGFEISHDFPGLGRRTMLVNARRIPSEAGDPILTLVAMQDITTRKEIEMHVEAGRLAAETANRAKDEFIALLSHELRTPLSAMLGWARILRSGAVDEARTAQGAEIIERNTRMMARLIEDLLDVSRMTTGMLGLELGPVDLNDVILASVEAVRPAADQRGVRLALQLDPSTGWIPGDRDRLQQVVWNLLANAIKFGATTVTVSLAPMPGRARIVVHDNGKGIASELLPHIFERFRQGQSGRDRAYGGLGLGLAIVWHLVERHGGAVRAESPGEGGGATFTVELPTAEADAAGTTAIARSGSDRPELSDAAVRLDGLRVLVVEDDRDTSDLLVLLLQQYGAEVGAVASSAEALAAFDCGHPDVLISDIGLPGEDGYALIRKVRGRPVDGGGAIPAIALTAFAGADAQQRSLDAGYHIHMNKPVDPGRLVAIVRQLAGQAAQRHRSS